MPGAVLYIRRESNQALAPVYRDRDGTDPYPSGTVVADENGYAYFYATDGLYRIQSLEPAIDWRDVLVGQLYGAVQRYETYADMAAALPQPEGTLAQVYADPDEELRGFYDLVDGAWVYSDPQPLTDEDVQAVIDARNTATAAASSASSSASTATGAASDASDSAALAEAWATKTDGPVAGGEFSAKHYAEQAQTNAGLPVYQSIPTSDVGPIYAVGIGPMEWDDDTAQYVPVGSNQWLAKAICEPFPIWDHIPGCPIPPTDNPDFRFIKLTAGDAYNSGVLTGESVSGTAPLVSATATISLAGSPVNGATVRLINTETRALRAGVSGTVQDDAFQNITGTLDTGHGANGSRFLNGAGTGAFTVTKQTETWMPAGTTSSGSNFTSVILFNSGDSPGARTANETRGKNIQATYYMRVL